MAGARRVILIILKFFLIVASLFCLSMISAVIAMKLVSRTDLVKVPSIIGKDTVYALEQLNKIGLRLKITGQEFTDSIPENRIISQDPGPFELTRRDRAVKVILSKGSEKVDVPNVVDEPWLRAQTLIQKAGLKIGHLAKVHHEQTEGKKVIAQNPRGNIMVPRGYAVDLLLSEGRPLKEFLMPELRGLMISVALKILSTSDISPGKITYQYETAFTPNRIISQNPKAGFKVSSGEKIDLVVSKAQKPDQEEIGIYTTLTYRVPPGLEKREVRILLSEGADIREIFHQIRSPGDEIELLVKTSRHTKARIYLDNELVEERQF